MSSLSKMLKILDLFDDRHSGVALDDVVAATGASRATAYRYLKELAAAGLVTPASGGTYVLGSRIIELDRVMRTTDPLARAARPIMAETSAALGLNMLLCSFYGDNVMCAEIMWPDASVARTYERGRAMPMFRGAMAKLILAHLTPYQLRNMLLWHGEEIATAGLGTTWEEFRGAMARIRRQASCVSRGEVVPGLVGIGAPVFDPDGRILGSIVFAVSDGRVAEIGEDALRQRIVAIAARIAAAIRADAPKGETAAHPARPRRVRQPM